MIINLKTQLVDFKGQPIEMDEQICPTCRRPIAPTKTILGDVLLTAINGHKEREELSLDEQRRRFRLGVRIASADEIEFSAAEIVLLEDQVRKFYAPVVTGQVCDLLEPPKS